MGFGGETMKKKDYKEAELDYLTRDQATCITGFTAGNLTYHARQGHLRMIKKLRYGDKGSPSFLYHVHDLRRLSWMTTYEVARRYGVDPRYLAKRVMQFEVEGAVRIGRKWRFPPTVAEKVGKWARRGYPVTRGFTLKGVDDD